MSRPDVGHDPMPWYLNRTLSPDESRAFEVHLAGCESCHEDMKELIALQRQIQTSGEALFEDHPDAESVTATALADLELDPERARAVQRHIEICGQCSLEVRWAQGRPATPTRSVPSSRHTDRPTHRWSWIAAAAAVFAVIAAVPVALWLVPRSETTRILDAYVLDSSLRANQVETIHPLSDAAGFSLVLQVDVAPEELPLDIVVRSDTGRIVFQGFHERPLLQGMFVVLYCDASSFPDGGYTVHVRPESDPARTTEYRFRVQGGVESRAAP